ncbi:MAG: hypothetical protein ACI4OI_06120 [Gemmiger sp.]
MLLRSGSLFLYDIPFHHITASNRKRGMMMASITQIALGCCILSALAGMLRSFWPSNGFRSVINAVLTLYIIAALVEMGVGADWSGLVHDLHEWTQESTAPTDYRVFGEAVEEEAILSAVQEVLRQGGVEATVTIEQGICLVLPVNPADKPRAETLLAQNCAALAYEVRTEGNAW